MAAAAAAFFLCATLNSATVIGLFCRRRSKLYLNSASSLADMMSCCMLAIVERPESFERRVDDVSLVSHDEGFAPAAKGPQI